MSRNLEWVRTNCRPPTFPTINPLSLFTVMIIPGDIGSDGDALKAVFEHLVSQYDAVCYVPGNHELWTRGYTSNIEELRAKDTSSWNSSKPTPMTNAQDSIVKMQFVLSLAESCGVHTRPLRLVLSNRSNDASQSPPHNAGGIVIIPLHAWYHQSWDTEPELTHAWSVQAAKQNPFHDRWGDFSLCSWPSTLLDANDSSLPSKYGIHPSQLTLDTCLAEAFARLNEPYLFSGVDTTTSDSSHFGSPIASPNDLIISFSHFLPRLELMPEKRYLLEPRLMNVIGSDVLETQIRRLQPHLHLCGHTHVPIDMTLDGIDYVQWPLGYAREATLQCTQIVETGPLLVVDTAMARVTGKNPTAAVETMERSEEGNDIFLPEINVSLRANAVSLERETTKQRFGMLHNSVTESSMMDTSVAEKANDRRSGAGRRSATCKWSQHYRQHPRWPQETQSLAPWVLAYLENMLQPPNKT